MPKHPSSPRRPGGQDIHMIASEQHQDATKLNNSYSLKVNQQCTDKENVVPQGSGNNDELNAGIHMNVSGEPEPTKFESSSAIRARKWGKPSACVFVASLPALLTDDELCRLVSHNFQKYGEISSVKV